MSRKFYITTPIYYVNNSPHIGHTYTTVAADVLARYHQMIGDKVFFLTGTDEHGAKIEAKAKEAGKEPKEFTNEISAKFQFAWDELNISNDRFIRTIEKDHIKAVQKALQFMYDKGDIYLGKHEGLYCNGCEQYLSKKDLVDGKCPDHKVKPEKISEESYMFKMSKYQPELLKKIEDDEFKIRPKEKKNEILSFYKNEGLRDISFSRKKVKWGIPLPWDKKHTAYVWADAFLNYLTGLDWTTSPQPSPSKGEGELFESFWPPDVQLMSKDILRVHATIWPAMLLSLGLPLPKQIFVHGYFLIDGQKMSKSLGNVIAPEDLVKRYGVDATRYLLMSATTFGHDGDISWQWFDEKYNADLANGIGNLVARSVKLASISEFKAPSVAKALAGKNLTNANVDKWGGQKFDHSVTGAWKEYQEKMIKLELDKVVELISGQQKFLDNYITTVKPWELIKNKDKQISLVMYNILERLRHIAWMLWPFMPETAEKIWTSLGLNVGKELAKDFKEAIKWGGLEPGTKVKKGEVLFPRI